MTIISLGYLWRWAFYRQQCYAVFFMLYYFFYSICFNYSSLILNEWWEKMREKKKDKSDFASKIGKWGEFVW